MEPEVLIYINKLKKYLETNKEAREHFLSNLNEEQYFERVTEVAIKNYIDKGDPTLSMEQFEFIRKVMQVEEIGNRDSSYYEPKIFIDKRGLETIIKTK